MAIISARRYKQGQPLPDPLPIDGAAHAPLPSGTFDWIGLADPTPDELKKVESQFGLHPLAVEDALNANQLPKAESYGKQLFVIARTAALSDGDVISYGETAMFLSCDALISVRHGSARAHVELRRQLEAMPERLEEGPDFVLHAIIDFIVDGYLPIIEHFETGVQDIEDRAIDVFPAPPTIRRIFRLRRELRKFKRIAGPMEEVCAKLAQQEIAVIDPSARPYFRDVLDHVRRVMGRVESLRETLASIVETAALLEQHRQGDMTRQLAAYAAILAVPTAIAGIYGMNFDFMPELRWRYGYFAVLGAIGAICAGLWWRFRSIGWL